MNGNLATKYRVLNGAYAPKTRVNMRNTRVGYLKLGSINKQIDYYKKKTTTNKKIVGEEILHAPHSIFTNIVVEIYNKTKKMNINKCRQRVGPSGSGIWARHVVGGIKYRTIIKK